MPSRLEEATEATGSPPVSLNTGSGNIAGMDRNKPNATKAKQCKSFRKSYTAEQVMKALADTQGGMSIKKAAAKWNVPRSSLQVFHRKGTYEPNCRPGPSSILAKAEEGLLTEWMIEMCRRGTLLFVLLFSMILVLLFCVTNKFDLIDLIPISKNNLLDVISQYFISIFYANYYARYCTWLYVVSELQF